MRRLIMRITAAKPSRFSASDLPLAYVTSGLVPREGAIGPGLVDG
jgi:hypothetical protein